SSNGRFPTAGLMADSAGNLYGATFASGTIFRVAVGTNTLTSSASFDADNGNTPISNLISDSAGNLYGMTYQGGASGKGTIFRVEAGTNTLAAIVSFNGENGSYPYYADLMADAAGYLCGTTTLGGANNQGTVFRFNIGT